MAYQTGIETYPLIIVGVVVLTIKNIPLFCHDWYFLINKNKSAGATQKASGY